tara:strand:- start:272 stop:469 length:198 start_codon:yes stop_codon:yes gene_type:complete
MKKVSDKRIADKIDNLEHFNKIYDHILLISKNLNNLVQYQAESTRALKEKITGLEKKIHLLKSDV